MATKPYERFRTLVEMLNERDRGLPDRKSANVSEWQQHCMLCLLGDHRLLPFHYSDKTAIHGSAADEQARVLEALATLMRNGVREFQP